ncbi:hypothetical protein EDB81DRAFT_897685 [Dactylonectria macrodidyma]|uniref:FTP domain-containing protein n=1 Tax=Dactylonectria macrodidyma TaxID=307937 RepID=A0A9P9FS98_9HYPO|nr:hypothetical protein EDB81DRAFT_897685 [Dactylonectria macrodidyma]
MRFILILGLLCLVAVNAFPTWHDGFDKKRRDGVLNAIEPPQNDLVATSTSPSKSLYCYYPADQLPEPKSSEKGADYLETAFNFVKALHPLGTFRLTPDYYISADGVGHVQLLQLQEDVVIPDARMTVNIDSNGDVLAYGGRFEYRKIEDQMFLFSGPQNRFDMDPLEALRGLFKALAIPINLKDAKPEATPDTEYKELNGRKIPKSYTFTGIKGVYSDPKAEFCLSRGQGGQLVYAWEIRISSPGHNYLAYIDATTNTQVLDVYAMREGGCFSPRQFTPGAPDQKDASSGQRKKSEKNILEALEGVVKALSLPFDIKHAKAKLLPPKPGRYPNEDLNQKSKIPIYRPKLWAVTGIKEGDSEPQVTAESASCREIRIEGSGYTSGYTHGWYFKVRFGDFNATGYDACIETTTNSQILDFNDASTYGCFDPLGGRLRFTPW